MINSLQSLTVKHPHISIWPMGSAIIVKAELPFATVDDRQSIYTPPHNSRMLYFGINVEGPLVIDHSLRYGCCTMVGNDVDRLLIIDFERSWVYAVGHLTGLTRQKCTPVAFENNMFKILVDKGENGSVSGSIFFIDVTRVPDFKVTNENGQRPTPIDKADGVLNVRAYGLELDIQLNGDTVAHRVQTSRIPVKIKEGENRILVTGIAKETTCGCNIEIQVTRWDGSTPVVQKVSLLSSSLVARKAFTVKLFEADFE